MPTLLEVQVAMRRSLLHNTTAAVSALLAPEISEDRLDIYRNTFLATLTKALRITFPASEKLVGAEFFEGAAQSFVEARPPGHAWLDLYGAEFPDFLRDFPAAASVPYLADVAALEWAVNGARHAPVQSPLDLARLAAVTANGQMDICFTPHPSVRLLRVRYPADLIWRAVLASDDEALGQIDLQVGPVHLLIEQLSSELKLTRMGEDSWLFLSHLCGGEALGTALDRPGDFDATAALAGHLADGRFVDFTIA
jgi:hypothetical protein